MRYRTRKIIMPAHLNGASRLFGGQALAWIDEQAAIFAICQLGTPRVVTKHRRKHGSLRPPNLVAQR